jgi:hypothetical protein
MFIAPLRHFRPKGVKWALHAHNEAREEGTVLHARSNKRLCFVFLSPTPGWNPPKKKAGTKAHVSVLRARSEEKGDGLLCFFPPTPGWNQSTFFCPARAQ